MHVSENNLPTGGLDQTDYLRLVMHRRLAASGWHKPQNMASRLSNGLNVEDVNGQGFGGGGGEITQL